MGVSGANDPTASQSGSVGFQGAHFEEGTSRSSAVHFFDGSTSLGGVWGEEPYLQSIGHPVLKEAILGLDDKPHGNQGEAQYTPTHAYYESFSENLEGLINRHELNEEQINQLIATHMTGVPSDDIFINKVWAELEGSIANELAEIFELPSTTEQAKNLRERANSHSNTVRREIANLQKYADSLPDGTEKREIQQKINALSKNLDGFSSHLDSLPENPTREQLARLSTKLGMSGENLKSLVGELGELASDNIEIKSILANFKSSVDTSVTQLDNLLQELFVSWEISIDEFSFFIEAFKNNYMNQMTQDFDAAFESQLSQFTDDPELQAQLRYAHYFPDAGVSDEINNLMQQVQQNAINQMRADGWSLPERYTPPTNGTSYAMKMQSLADDAFDAFLENYQPSLTSDQQQQVRNMYFGVIAPSGNLGAISAELEAMVAAELAVAFGLPDGFPVPKGSFSHRGNIHGQFQMKFMELLNGLPTEQRAAVLQALSDSLNSAVSPQTIALLNQLFNDAVGAIRAQFGLPNSWSPPSSVLREISTMSPTNQIAARGVTDMETEVALAIQYVEQMADSPTKAMLLNVLKIVSEAIAELKIQIAIIMQKDAELSAKLSQTQLETAMLKVHENLKKLKKMKQKKGKMKNVEPLFKFMKVVSFMFTAVLAIIAGPVSWAILGVMTVDLIMNGLDSEQSLLSKAFDAVADGVASIMMMMGFPPALAELGGIIVNVLICIAIALTASTAFAVNIFFSCSGVMQSLFTDVFGCDPLVGEIVGMISEMAVEIAIEIIVTVSLTIVISVLTGGAGASVAAMYVAARIGMFVGRVMQMTVQFIMRLAQTLQKIAMMAQRFARLSQRLMKLSVEVMNFSLKVDRYARKVIQWSQRTQKLTKQVVENARRVRWTEMVKNMFRKSSKTGVKEFDDAVNALKIHIDLAKWLFRGLGFSYLSLQTATVAVQYKNSMIAAEIARLRGDMEAIMTELEAFIQILRKMIAKILDSLNDVAEWIAQIGQMQGEMWNEASSTMDAVAASNQAS